MNKSITRDKEGINYQKSKVVNVQKRISKCCWKKGVGIERKCSVQLLRSTEWTERMVRILTGREGAPRASKSL